MHLRLLRGPEARCYDTAHIHPINFSQALKTGFHVHITCWEWFLACVSVYTMAKYHQGQYEPHVCQGGANKWPVWTKELLHLQTLHSTI